MRTAIWQREIVFAVFFLILGANPAKGTIRRVDVSRASGGNGTTWSQAYNNLAQTLSQASAGDEIWVAAGTYFPGSNQSDVFTLRANVQIYGGFLGVNHPTLPNGETQRDQRNYAQNVTILSGDIGQAGNYVDNCYTVVKDVTGLATARLDGFVITGGNGGQSGYGAGVFVGYGSSPTIQNCRIIGCYAPFGGGMWIDASCSPVITDCTFESNVADYGGAISLASSSTTLPTFARCKFIANVALVKGGAVLNDAYGATVRFRECLFIANEARTDTGGAISNESAAQLRLENCAFSRNVAFRSGGAIDCEYLSTLTLTN